MIAKEIMNETNDLLGDSVIDRGCKRRATTNFYA